MRQRLEQFMQGRYGVDQMNRFTIAVAFVVMILSMFMRSGILNYVAVALLIYSYYRMLSRNISKRYAENEAYLKQYDKVTGFFHKKKSRFAQRDVYRFFKCPTCKQEVRVPRGKGKICITCPKCRTEFVKKS